MAEIIQVKKSNPRVDLTPMVDLGFLLITFFIMTATMQEQKVLKFFLPADGESTLVGASTSLTLVPSENNTVLYFNGKLEDANFQQMGVTGFSLTDGVGQLIRDKKTFLKKIGREKDLTILVYPDNSSTYKNLVDIIDEILINDVHTYCVTSDEPAIAALKTKIMAAGK